MCALLSGLYIRADYKDGEGGGGGGLAKEGKTCVFKDTYSLLLGCGGPS